MKWRCSMNRALILNKVKESFMLKRVKAEEECDEFVSKLRMDDGFNRLYGELTAKMIERFRENNDNLEKEIADLNDKIRSYLTNKNIDYTRLKPKYECKDCNDTGIFNGKMCHCLLNALNKEILERSSNKKKFKKFSDANLNIMDENDKKAMEILRTWTDKYPSVNKININLIGGAGMGKTFLMECVASALINKGISAVFVSAFELNESARRYHIGKAYDFSNYIDAEVLLIDDLGSEPVLKNITKEYLYNLINVRQNNNRPTIISTNLSLDNILDRYDERIFSRLCNKQYSINILFNSNDKRVN